MNPSSHDTVVEQRMNTSGVNHQPLEEQPIKEWEIAKVITDFLETRAYCGQKPILAHLKRHFNIKKFEQLGYGKFSPFVRKWKIIFEKPAQLKPTEEELVEVIRQSYEQHGRINYALTAVREKFGSGPFGQFGFGIFRDFCTHHSKEIYGSDVPKQYRPGRGKYESRRDDEPQRQALLRGRDRSPKRSSVPEPSLDELRNRVRSSIKVTPVVKEIPIPSMGPLIRVPLVQIKCYELFPTTMPEDDLPLSSNKEILSRDNEPLDSQKNTSSGEYALFPQNQIKDDLPLTSWRDQVFSSDVDRFLSSFRYRDKSPPRYREKSPSRYKESNQGKGLPIFMSIPN